MRAATKANGKISRPLSDRQVAIAGELETEPQTDTWYDWQWQLRHAVRDLATFERLLGVTIEGPERRKLEETVARFPLSITPYYLSLIDPEDWQSDPVCRQAFPSWEELTRSPHDMADPLHEDVDSPVPGVTHRYPDRVLFHISNTCAMYCRHCTRKRKVGDSGHEYYQADLEEGLDYIRKTPQVRDVLLSGGDPLMLHEETLDWLLGALHEIEHVEIVRIGTRIPVVLPYRITDSLVRILARHHPLWLNTHFNHPREISQSAREALAKLANAGIPLGNQSVLLAGVNDCPRIMKALVQKLVKNRVRPYYLYQCDLSEGLSHFRTPVGKGIEIIESLIGHTSGLCVPTYVVDAPGGGGKIPVQPNYVVSWSTNKVVLRNYEGVFTTYKEPDSYEPRFCDRDCENCELLLPLDEVDESRSIGIAHLLDDSNGTVSLIPRGNERLERRED